MQRTQLYNLLSLQNVSALLCPIPKEFLHQVLYLEYVCVWGGEAGKREQTSWTCDYNIKRMLKT
jgi:hypothetical protein